MKQQLADTLKERFAEVTGRGKLFGHALKVRADMAAIRRRLRTTYAELGEQVYRRLRDGDLDEDHQLLTVKERIDELLVEVREREAELNEIVYTGNGPGDGASR